MHIPEPGPSVPRRGGRLRAAIGRGILTVLGWKVEGGLGIALVFSLRLDARFLGKDTLFRGPLGALMRWLGGIPVDRTSPEGVVDQVAARFRSEPQLVLGIAPEGNRRPVDRWKSGFYRIAVRAGVPIVPGVFDNGARTMRLLPAFAPTGDADGDIAALRALYADVRRRNETGAPVPA
jgi:1-acyl-sn-glycerol-3-phosphate acyltransferase